MGITQELAAWLSALKGEDLPEDTLERVKGLVMDFFRACAVGAQTPWGASVRDLVTGLGGRGDSTILVFGDRLDAGRAALVNGSFAHSADIDDTHVGSMLHPGAAVLPAVVALGEHVRASGRQVLSALVAGYETAIRIGLAVQPSHFQRGFQATGTCGAFGAAAGAAKILGLDAAQTAGALGTAGSSAAALAQFYYSGSSVKRIHAGRAAESGVMAALYATQGVVGPADVLEGQAGFGHAYADAFEPNRISDGLGSDFKLAEVTIKPHGTSARLQASVQAAQDICRRNAIDPRSIRSITAAIPKVIAGRLTQADPPDVTAAQMSLPFTLGLTFVLAQRRGPGQPIAVDDYRDMIDDPEVRRLARATHCEIDAEIDAATTDEVVPARLTVVLEDGSALTAVVSRPWGAPGEPLPPEERARLLRASARNMIAPGRVDEVIERIETLERCVDIRDVTRLFTRAARGATASGGPLPQETAASQG